MFAALQTLLDQLLNLGGSAEAKAAAKPGSKATAKTAKPAAQSEAVRASSPPPGPVPIDLVMAARLQLSEVK